MTVVASCFSCEQGWEHCHHAAIAHADGRVECAGGDLCALAPELHDATVECLELIGGCGCVSGERPRGGG